MGREENLETQTLTGPRDQRRFEKCLKHLSSTSLLPLAGSEQGWMGICRWDQSSSRLRMRVPKMHRAMLQVTEPPLSPASLLPLPQGLHHPQGCSCTHTLGLQHQLQQCESRRLDAASMAQDGEDKGSRRTPRSPAICLQRGRQSHPHCRIKGKATPVAELTLRSRNKSSSSGHSWLQQPSLVSPTRPADPRIPDNRPQPPTSAWAQTCRKCYCNINN